MKNSIGNNIILTVFGESHGEFVGATIDGFPAGIQIDIDYVNKEIAKRKAVGKISTPRKEEDEIKIISGVFNGFSTGTPITVIIKNNNVNSKDYEKTKNILRPGHADFTANEKYFGFQDYRGGGHFSGRVTVGIVALGAICKKALLDKNIKIATHIKQLNNISDVDFDEDFEKQIDKLNNINFAVIDDNVQEEMIKKIEDIRDSKNSVGGILETIVINLPSGLGDPMFDSVEGCISKALFGIGAIKGIEFGDGFKFANMLGSESNDSFIIVDNKIKTKTNHNGGINGGITNSMPLIIKTAIKPTPSISLKQKSVDINLNEEVDLEVNGRHDPSIIHRVRVVVDSIISIVIMDLIVTRFGQKWSEILCED